MPKGFEALSCVPFRWLISALLCFFLGMQGQLLVRSLLAWELTKSELALGYVNLVVAVPMVAMSFFAGAIIDRVERRNLLILTQALIMGNELLLLALILLHKLTFPVLLLSSFLMGVLFPFVMPTRSAMVFGMVGRELLGNAMALQSAVMNVGRIVGPAVTGALIPLLTLPGAYGVAITLHAVATVTTFMLPRSFPDQKARKSLLGDMLYSFTYIGQHRPIMLVLLFGLFPILLMLPTHSLLVVFADDVWHVGEHGLGLLMAMVGAGGISGAFLVARLSNSETRTRWMLITATLFGVTLAAFSLSPSFYLALALLLAASMLNDISQTMNNTIVQVLAHNEVRGRMSSMLMLSLGLTPLAVLPATMAAEHIGVAHTIFAACLIMLGIVVLFVVLSPTLRRLDAKMSAQIDAEHL
ncbi:MAG TPA: MFS transporter [Candidatus Acidoferrum sp.]|nr:MFS transporter [Candidatus Acidoferrum sp.]